MNNYLSREKYETITPDNMKIWDRTAYASIREGERIIKALDFHVFWSMDGSLRLGLLKDLEELLEIMTHLNDVRFAALKKEK